MNSNSFIAVRHVAKNCIVRLRKKINADQSALGRQRSSFCETYLLSVEG